MARGIWKGSIGFGLVTIGVELYNAEAPERLDLDLLDKRDMSHIGYLKINKTTGKPVDIGFVAANEIPLIYYAKPYIVGPIKGSEKAYLLFRDTLAEMQRVAP